MFYRKLLEFIFQRTIGNQINIANSIPISQSNLVIKNENTLDRKQLVNYMPKHYIKNRFSQTFKRLLSS